MTSLMTIMPDNELWWEDEKDDSLILDEPDLYDDGEDE